MKSCSDATIYILKSVFQIMTSLHRAILAQLSLLYNFKSLLSQKVDVSKLLYNQWILLDVRELYKLTD